MQSLIPITGVFMSDIHDKVEEINNVAEKFHNKKDETNIVVFNPISYPERMETKTGFKALDTYKNLKWLLMENFNATIRFNMMTRRREITIPGHYVFKDDSDNDILSRIDRLAVLNGMPIKKLDKHLDVIAGESPYHPIVKCIQDKPWDGFKRLDSFLATIHTDNMEYSTKITRTWMVGAIAAAFSEDGFINQGVLVLAGAQGINKTRWVKSLDPIGCGAVKEGAFLDPSNKDSLIQLASYWIAELGELDSIFGKSAMGRLKSYITMQFDHVRFPYAYKPTVLARRTAYVATVNEENYLIDQTGNRRWWTLSVTKIDLDHDLDMQQVWAEVYDLWQRGALPYLSQEDQELVNEKNTQHEKIDPIKEKLLSHCDWENGILRKISATDLFYEMFGKHGTRGEVTSLGSTLKELTKKLPEKTKFSNLHEIPQRRSILFK